MTSIILKVIRKNIVRSDRTCFEYRRNYIFEVKKKVKIEELYIIINMDLKAEDSGLDSTLNLKVSITLFYILWFVKILC